MAYERDSYMVSDYHRLFVEMGYPELDILKYPDGEWHIIQYYSRPIIPCLTKWQVVLGPMRNVDISRGFLEKYIRQCDITKRAFWDREERKTQEVETEHASEQRRRVDYVNRAHEAITRNPSLMGRIAENGIQEMDIPSIARHVPRSEVVKSTLKGEQYVSSSETSVTTDAAPSGGGDANVCSSSEPA
jgi:hypothetical protein